MAKRGRGNILPRETQEHVIEMLVTRNPDIEARKHRKWLWSISDIAEENDIDPKTVRKIIREWLLVYWTQIKQHRQRYSHVEEHGYAGIQETVAPDRESRGETD